MALCRAHSACCATLAARAAAFVFARQRRARRRVRLAAVLEGMMSSGKINEDLAMVICKTFDNVRNAPHAHDPGVGCRVALVPGARAQAAPGA